MQRSLGHTKAAPAVAEAERGRTLGRGYRIAVVILWTVAIVEIVAHLSEPLLPVALVAVAICTVLWGIVRR